MGRGQPTIPVVCDICYKNLIVPISLTPSSSFTEDDGVNDIRLYLESHLWESDIELDGNFYGDLCPDCTRKLFEENEGVAIGVSDDNE